MEDQRFTQLHPGPLDHSVLTRQNHHRSKDVWNGEVEKPILCRRSDGNFWNLVHDRPIHRRVLQILIDAGFYGVYRVGRIQLDHAFITSLVERWRPETHTFHLRVGEATITLQDVAILYGLPVEGRPVLGIDSTRKTEEWQDMCDALLGFRPHSDCLFGSRLEISALATYMEQLPLLDDDADEVVVHQMARCYMLWMIGGILFPDTSGNKVKLMYLTLLDDITQIGMYSWGSAVLACLYRALCRATRPKNNELCGFIPLLQVWAWERLKMVHPDRRQAREGAISFSNDLPGPPHASKWNVQLSWTHTTQYVLPLLRDQLDNLVDEHFVWEPYTPDVMENLPEYCRSGEYFWHAMVPLLCWDVLEMHQPNRVLRQFRMRQFIPVSCNFEDNHDMHDRRGRQNTDWAREHVRPILVWNDRANRVCEAQLADGPVAYDDDYLVWYRRITRQIIGNPSIRFPKGYASLAPVAEVMARQLHMIYQYGIELRQQPSMEVAGRKVMEMCSDGLTAAIEAQRLRVQPMYVPVEQPVVDHAVNPHKRGRAGRRKKRRAIAATNVEERSEMSYTNSDLERDRSAGGSVKGDGNLNVEPELGMDSSQFAEPRFDMAPSSTQFGDGERDGDGDGSELHNVDIQLVLYQIPPSQQFDMINFGDGFDDDGIHHSPACPVRLVNYDNTPSQMTLEASCVTTIGSADDKPMEQAIPTRGRGQARFYKRRVNNNVDALQRQNPAHPIVPLVAINPKAP